MDAHDRPDEPEELGSTAPADPAGGGLTADPPRRAAGGDPPTRGFDDPLEALIEGWEATRMPSPTRSSSPHNGPDPNAEDLDDEDGDDDGGEPDEPEDEDDESDDDDEEEDEEDEAGETVTIEINGLSLYTHHGLTEAEREVGQRLVLDLRLELGQTDATVTDRVRDTVDYGEVCQLVALIAQQRSHRTLERLCASIAERLLGDYEIEAVWVKASKPQPPIPLIVDEVSVEVWREADR